MRLAFIILMLASAVTSYSSDLKAGSKSNRNAQKIPHANANYPVVGQSKADCRKQFDDPCQLGENPDGTEVWVYFFAKEKVFIPASTSMAKLTVLRINFDSAGRVSRWSTSQQTES